ncbi:MAG: sugar ABC transporter ATP-binding protein [Spirochaetales bacterium]|nr:sugar ABC transporter ATP-binding protein [Spirochaetales bacterium]
MNEDLILSARDISKSFGGLLALDKVHLDVRYGEVHAVVGENGAGKSTLMRILGGIITRDSGQVMYRNQQVDFSTPMESISAGIAVIHQELSMLPSLNVIENIYMGRMDHRFGRILWKTLEQKTAEAMDRVGLRIDPYVPVHRLGISQRQLVEIAKALSINASLIIMDEPNSSLTQNETQQLFDVIKGLNQQGISIIYVSHKIEEVLQISDRITVLRDGRRIGTIEASEASQERIVQMMVGRELQRTTQRRKHVGAEVLLEVRNLRGQRFQDISFCLHRGEILGFAGLVGAGRSELARAIFGVDPYESGEILLEGRPVRLRSAEQAIQNGLAMLQEDRKELSLFMGLPIWLNIAISKLPGLSRGGVIARNKVNALVQRFIRGLNIKIASPEHPVSSLSGGNQQKTTLARWLATDPKILLLDEPTHGIDVGAKAEIYRIMRELADGGMGIVLISSELPEIVSIADRVAVMHQGRLTALLEGEQVSEGTIMQSATGLLR